MFLCHYLTIKKIINNEMHSSTFCVFYVTITHQIPLLRPEWVSRRLVALLDHLMNNLLLHKLHLYDNNYREMLLLLMNCVGVNDYDKTKATGIKEH